MQAIALSVKADGVVDELHIGGRLATEGDRVTTLEVEGTIGSCAVAGGIEASGEGSDAVHLTGDGANLDHLTVTGRYGENIRHLSP